MPQGASATNRQGHLEKRQSGVRGTAGAAEGAREKRQHKRARTEKQDATGNVT